MGTSPRAVVGETRKAVLPDTPAPSHGGNEATMRFGGAHRSPALPPAPPERGLMPTSPADPVPPRPPPGGASFCAFLLTLSHERQPARGWGQG